MFGAYLIDEEKLTYEDMFKYVKRVYKIRWEIQKSRILVNVLYDRADMMSLPAR